MKKFYFLLLFLSIGLSSVFANGVERTYTNVQAGGLSTQISNDNVDPLTITKLTLTGQLNGTDFRLLRAMAGHDYQGQPTEGKLNKLDISGVTIVAGGENYLDTDQMKFENGTWFSSDGYHYTTQDNCLGLFLFAGCSALTEIKLPSNLTAINGEAFSYTSLKELIIPKSVNSISTNIISNCRYMESLIVEEGNTTYKSDNYNAIISGTTLLVGCKNSIIPDYITKIGGWAFFGCEGFNGNNGALTLPNGLKAIEAYSFADCSFSSVVLPDGLETIDFSAFARNTALTSITIPASVTYIGRSILEGCTNLSSVVIASGNPKYDSRDNCNAIIETATNKLIEGFENTVIPQSVTTIGENAYYQCYWLKEMIIPKHITSIERYAFTNCNNVTFQVENMTPIVISEDAFEGLWNCTLRVPAGCKAAYSTATGWNKFSTILEGNEGSTFIAKTAEGWDMVFTVLDENANTCQVGYLDGSWDKTAVNRNAVNGAVTIPQTVEGYNVVKIGRNAFENISGMTSITIPNTVTAIDEAAFNYCNGLTSFELPASVTNIGNNAFPGLNNATSIKVAEGNQNYDSRDNCNAIIETATKKLLYGCKNTIIPASVKEIGSNAFSGVLYNSTLLIPSTITKIDDYAFSGNNITLQVEHTKPLTISENVFQNLKNSTLRVPASCKAAYAAATGWSKFDNILEGDEGSFFTAKTAEGWDMVFTILDDNAKTCQVGYIDGSWDKVAVDRNAVNGSVTIPQTVEGYTVVKIGKSAFENIYGMSSITIPNTVTAIDESALGYNGLTSFELPASVITIGNWALSGLNSATSIKVAEGNTKYDSRNNCNAIIETATNKLLFGFKNTIIPTSVTEIGSWAFNNVYNCTLAIPSTITTIDEFAFSGDNLTLQVEYTTPLAISENVFQGLNNSILRVPAGCKAAYESATGWKNFTTILEGNDGATFIAKTSEGIDMAFTILDDNAKTCQVGYLDGSWDKTAIDRNAVNSAVTIPQTVEGYTVVKIGKYAFDNAYGMTSVTIPNTVTAIDEYAFDNCNGLTSFELPASVTSIGNWALNGLNNVLSIKVAEGNQNYDSRDNCNAIIETATNKLLFGYNSTKIPTSVKEIGNWAFSNVYNCTLTIPSTITTIDDYAFSYSSNLDLEIGHTTPLQINENVFEGLYNSTLLVPAGCKAAYAAATGWNKFSNIIEENKVSKNVATAGTLSQLISNDEKFTITELTITGQLNGTDFRLIREMAGCDDLGHPTGGKLKKLDISGANIVSGGDKYFDSDGLFDEYGNMRYGFGKFSVTTRDYVISECLFVGCSKLVEIKIPENTIEIGKYAFMCTNISSLDIPKTIKKVDLSFFFSTKVSNLQIPQNVTTLTASDGFIGNQSTLTSVTVDANNTKYDSRNDCNAIIEKESNTLILGCKNTIIPDDVTSIGTFAFSYCSGLTSITIPTSVTSLQDGSFFASRLNSISCSSTLKRIGGNALAYNNITSITIPASVEYIGQSALRGCSELTEITVEAGNTIYDSRDNCNAIIETATNTLIQGCNTATIPASVTAIGTQAFQECYHLASIIIPSSVSSIADFAFADCYNLTSVSVEAETPLVISEYTFTNRYNATLYVPAGSKSAYEAADYWKEFKEIMEKEVTKVTLNKTKAVIEKGKSKTLKATVYPSTLEDQSVTWTSSDTKIATVSSSGKVKGVKGGTVTITCTSNATGATATCEVTVGYVKLNETEIAIEKGKTKTLKATVYPSTLEDRSVTWTSSDTKIATVSSSGEVKGVKGGIVTITCTSNATGLSANCTVTVGYVKLNETEIAIEKGKSKTLKSTVYPSTLEDRSVTWTSSDTKIATVSSSGEIKGVKGGIVTITCTSNATGLSESCKVTIGYVKLNETEIAIEKGKSQKLKSTVYPSTLEDKSVTWTSSDTKIATVSSSGKVKGVKGGIVTITCTSNATGLSESCTVTVGYVKLNETEITIEKGKSKTLKSTVYPSTLEDRSVTWTSSNTKIATVSSSGKVKGVKAGTATITCTSNATGLSTSCTVTVLAVIASRPYEGDIDEMDKTSEGVEPFDVYDLSGRKVRHQVTSLDGLPKGIYIVNGKKIMK